MGFECDDFPFTFKTGVVSSADTLAVFEEGFFSALDASCNLFICNIFAQSATTDKETIDLDQCFIPSDQTYTRKQLPHICPLLNSSLFDSKTQNNSSKLKFVAEYLVYLGLKRVAIRLDSQTYLQILSQLLKIAKILKKGRVVLIFIVSSGENKDANETNWRSYIELRSKIGGQINYELCLEVGSDKNTHDLDRWMGESIVYGSFTEAAFTTNQKGYPVLTTAYQTFLKRLLHCQIHISITLSKCLKQKLLQFPYFAHILAKVTENMTEFDIAAHHLVDYLQVPLQPYRDNLDAQVYDIFEKDDHKYEEYQIACQEALEGFKEPRTVIAYYVGSGKGLILQKFIKAAKKAQKKVKVYCVEKNPYPIQTLKRRIIRNKWSKFVETVQTDIRTYEMPEHPDIIFSELLGGFGDNELSPECLKWAEKNCTKNTVFIPQIYRSFIRPISAHHLHKQLEEKEREQYFTVYLDKFYSPFQSQKIWEFSHPLPADDKLTRHTSLEWEVKEVALVNGFEGSFDCTLFGKAYFSIVPENKDKNFYSWFPLYFSFKEEELLERGQKIVIEMARKSTESRIWYEWRYLLKDVDGQLRKESKWHNENASLTMVLELEKDE